MALFHRANSNAFSLLNYCYCKKFTVSPSRLKSSSRNSISSIFTQQSIRKNKQKFTDTESTHEAEIIRRRDQACRSLLIQVYSAKSHNDLHSYCSQFGDILSMHHYHTNKQHNYILVEFKNEDSIKEAMSFASFTSDCVAPVKSSVFWFRKRQESALQKSNRMVSLTVENGCTIHTDQQIAKLLCNTKSVSGQIIVLYETLKLTDLEVRLRFHTAHHLEQYFSRLFQNMKVLPFGSSINGFGRERCDLDLVLIPDNDPGKNNAESRLVFHSKSMKYDDKNETKQFLRILANSMEHFIPGVLNVRKILEARVPIIKFRYDYTQTECDLSATNTRTAIYMTELLNLYGEIDWRVRPLVIAIRVWAKCQEITSAIPGMWITNFPLTLLVLFYLQQKKILPSLKTLKLYATRNDIRLADNGIDCTFLRDINKLPDDYKYKTNQDSLESLLYGFFEYYSTFDFYLYGICIREGVKIRKPSRSALHICNPLETTLNVCKNVNLYELNRIVSKSHDAIYMLETADKSSSNDWGIIALLKVNNNDIVNPKKLNSMEEQTIEELENHSDEISDKFEMNVDETKTKKTEIV